MSKPYLSSSGAGSHPNQIHDQDHVRGSENASLTLIQYGDFKRAGSRRLYSVISEVREKLGPELKYVYRHFPQSKVPSDSNRIAEAAEAASAQDAFWPMHDYLYEHQLELNEEDLTAYAEAIDLDIEQFEADLNNHCYKERIEEGRQEDLSKGINCAPALFVNGELYEGKYTVEALCRELAASDCGSTSPKIATDGGRRSSGEDLRETIERSEHGAPAAGSAVRDRFSADEIFQRIVATAHEEFKKKNRLLFLSGLAAGFAMSLSFIGTASLTALISGRGGSASAAGYLLYPLGFLFVVLGSYQLFTENTLTPVTLVMTRVASIPALLKIWGFVSTANVLGVAASAYVLANTGVFSPAAMTVAREIGLHFFELSWMDIFWKGVFAGVLIAGMVWLIHAAQDTTARILVIFTLAYAVGAAELAHCIVGSAETLYVVFSGQKTIWEFFSHFLVPATLGNTVGGVVLVALLNYSHTRDRRLGDHNSRSFKLDWKKWLFGNHIGHSNSPTSPKEDDTAEID